MISEDESIINLQNEFLDFLRCLHETGPYIDSIDDMRNARDLHSKLSQKTLEFIAENFKTLMEKKRKLLVLHARVKVLYEQHKRLFPNSSYFTSEECRYGNIEDWLEQMDKMLKENAPIEEKYFYLGALTYLERINSGK
ncbi:hypothetical protein J4221_04920 [Candidatus Pacearchaeota archaeon]|nr:hypothetical protein [Candidatus Pacearchaeota archaeon]